MPEQLGDYKQPSHLLITQYYRKLFGEFQRWHEYPLLFHPHYLVGKSQPIYSVLEITGGWSLALAF